MISMLLILCLLGGLCVAASAEEAASGFLGKPFPDFSVTDTDGNTFTLSEALKDHQAVLINFWATWCGPCRREFPFLNEAYEKYRDRVAFIALSTEPKDTQEQIAAYRKENGIAFPMGRDEGMKLYRLTSATGIPATLVVDRFGNASFFHAGAFHTAKEAELVLDAFLGDGYQETTVLNAIPRDTSTRSFPVSAARAIYPESGSYKKISFHMDANPKPVTGYIIPEDSVRLRIEVAADDDVVNMTYMDLREGTLVDVLSLLDPERGVYVYDQALAGPEDEEAYVQVELYDRVVVDESVDKQCIVFLFPNEESVDKLAEKIKELTSADAGWEYVEDALAGAGQAYVVHVVDQDNNPVGEVSVNFCTDAACVPKESDDNGLVTFTGAPDVYHVQIIDAPDGYSWDEDYEMYTAREYGEWVLRIRKDN